MLNAKYNSAKEQILKSIRQAIQEKPVAAPYPDINEKERENLFTSLPDASVEEIFAEKFIQAGGRFVFCNTWGDFIAQMNGLVAQMGWKEVLCADNNLFTQFLNEQSPYIRQYAPSLGQAAACITTCEAALARTGSLVFSSKQFYGRTSTIYLPAHIVVLRPNQIVNDIEDALKLIKFKYRGVMPSMINFTTGPSRTADIEKTLVKGIHGPKEIYCFLLNE